MKTWVTAKWVPLAFDFAERELRKHVCKADIKARALADFSDNNMESK
jgi:hypothetical protein